MQDRTGLANAVHFNVRYYQTQQLISFPGGHQEGFPDTSKQFFKEFYGHLAGDRKTAPSYPTFRDGLRELELCDRILESAGKGAWVTVSHA